MIRMTEGQKVAPASNSNAMEFGSGSREKAIAASNGPEPTINSASPNQNIFGICIVPPPSIRRGAPPREKTPSRLDGVKFGRRRHKMPTCREMDLATIRRYFGHDICEMPVRLTLNGIKYAPSLRATQRSEYRPR